jgi:hypothetical protein
MKEFAAAALPWIILGIAIAVLAVKVNKRKNDGTEEDETKGDCMSEGMCLGMCFGMLFGTMGVVNLGLGLSLGMLIGMTAGMFVKK